MQVMNVNMDQQMLSKIENNRRIVTDYELACLCRILNVTERELLADFYDGVPREIKKRAVRLSFLGSGPAQNRWITPAVSREIRPPAITTPAKMAGMAWRIRMSSSAATSAPVQVRRSPAAAPPPIISPGRRYCAPAPLQVGPAPRLRILGPKKIAVPQPVKDPANQQHDKRHRHHIAQNRRHARNGRGQSRGNTHRDGAPQFQNRHHGGQKRQQDLVKHRLFYGHERSSGIWGCRAGLLARACV